MKTWMRKLLWKWIRTRVLKIDENSMEEQKAAYQLLTAPHPLILHSDGFVVCVGAMDAFELGRFNLKRRQLVISYWKQYKKVLEKKRYYRLLGCTEHTYVL